MKKRSKTLILSSVLLGGLVLAGTTGCDISKEDVEEVIKNYSIANPVIVTPEGGSFSMDPAKATGKVGDTVDFLIEVNDGYTLESIKINGSAVSNDTRSFKPIEGSNKIEITFKRDANTPDPDIPDEKTGTVVLKFDAAKGSVEVNKTEGKIDDDITLTVTAKDTYEVKEVKVNGKVVTLTDNKVTFKLVEGVNNVEVTFKKKDSEPEPVLTGTVKVNATENGKVVASKESGNVGDEIILTVTPAENYLVGDVKVGDEVITPVEGVYKFALKEGENVVSVTFIKKPADPVESKVIYIKAYGWFHEANAIVGVKCYDSYGNQLAGGENGALATDAGIDEVSDTKYWTYTTPENTASIKITRTNNNNDNWGVQTVSIDVKKDLAEKNLIVLPEEKSFNTSCPVTFETFDPNTPLPTFPSLGLYTFNVTFDTKWSEEIAKDTSILYVHRWNFFDKTLNTSWPGAAINDDFKDNKYTFTGEVKQNSKLLFHINDLNEFKSSDISIEFDKYATSKSVDIKINDDNSYTVNETGKEPEAVTKTKFTVTVPDFFDDGGTNTNIYLYSGSTDGDYLKTITLPKFDPEHNTRFNFEIEIPDQFNGKDVTFIKIERFLGNNYMDKTEMLDIAKAKSEGKLFITLTPNGDKKLKAEFTTELPPEPTNKGTVKINATENGTVTASKDNGNVGEEIVLTITPNAGFVIGQVKVGEEVIVATDGTYKFNLKEGENVVTVTFGTKAADTIESKLFYIKAFGWFYDADADVCVKCYDSLGNQLFTETHGILAERLGFDEVNNVKYWSFTTPKNTATLKLTRTNKGGKDHWGSETISIDVRQDLAEKNLVVISQDINFNNTCPVTFDNFDATQPLPTFPSLGCYTFNITFGTKWANEIAKEGSKVNIYRWNFFDGTLDTAWPGEDVTSKIKDNKVTFEGEVKQNSRFLININANDAFKSKDIVIDYNLYKEGKIINITINDDNSYTVAAA